MTYQTPMPSPYGQSFPTPPPPAQPGSGLATGSFITGIVSVVLCGLGAVIGPVAVVLGIVARSRTRSDSKAVWGIVLGAVGTLLSVVAIVSAITIFANQKDAEAQEQQAEDPIATTEPTADPVEVEGEGGIVLTEQGIAASEFDTAYAAYLGYVGVSQEFDGMFDGSTIDTPCFTMDGEAWWVIQGTTETCAPASELWWETASDSAEPEIAAFGWGVAGAAISFEPLTTDLLMSKFNSTDLQPVADYVRDTLLPESGATDIVESQIQLGGLPAVQFDCAFEHLAAYRLDVVILPEPRTLDDGTEIRGFIVHAYNEAEWVYKSEDVFARLDTTLVWK